MTNIQMTSEIDHAIINLVDRILATAIDDRTSYIYFEPQSASLQVRVRRDGLLQIALNNLSAEFVAPTIAYLKSIASIDKSLTAPQTNTIYKSGKIGQAQLKFTTLPTQFGDSITVEITSLQQQSLMLNQLIAHRHTCEKIEQLIDSDRGLILVVGGENSNKSSTIDASLTQLQRADLNIYSIDCQPKYLVPGINQITLPSNANHQTRLDTIHACLAQNPDVLSIGSIDSLSLAQTALQAVAQGCLVFATVSAETAGTAIAYLVDLGISSARLYTATIGIISQKMIKQVCEQCRIAQQPDPLELTQIGSTILSLNDRRSYYQANQLSPSEIERAKRSGELCPSCRGLGYCGSIDIHQVLIVTDRLKSIVISGDAEQIDLAAQELGMGSFVDLAISLFRSGKTTLSEVKRCVPPKTLLQNHIAQAETYPDPDDLAVDQTASLEIALYWQQQAIKATSSYDHLSAELAKYQQESAEFEQRIKHSRVQAEQGTRAEIALQFLSVIDVIELARTSIKPQTDREAAIQKGYSMLENKMMASIREIGVKFTESQGQKFDPRFHEIVQEIVTHEHPAGSIISELKRGYTLGDRVLRLAQVKVAVASSFR